jgi:methionine synthase I (cobalamin-dependent)
MHKGYFEAGSNIVCTNTFGENGLHFDDAKPEEIISQQTMLRKNVREVTANSPHGSLLR